MKVRVKITVLFMSMVLFAAGCNSGTDTPESTEKSVSEAASVQDEVALDWKQSTMKVEYGTLRTEYDSTTYEDVDYYFEAASLEQEEKERYVKEIAAFLNEVKQGEAFSGGLTVYVGDCITTTCLPGELYINTEDRELPQTFFRMLLSVKDQQSVNAGQVYGLALKVYEAVGIGTVNPVHDSAELAEYFSKEDNLYLLDFALPMFETHYFEEETVQYVKDAATAFVGYCIQTQGIEKAYELCDTWKAEELVALKNDWLAELGVTAAYEQFTELVFSYNNGGDTDFPYVIKGELANWYFQKEDVVENGYKTFAEGCETINPLMTADFSDAQQVLKAYTGDEVPAVDIYTVFTENEKYSAYSQYAAIYNPQSDGIFLFRDWEKTRENLLHEYVHYLTLGNGKIFSSASGLVEGWTEAVAVFSCENRMKTEYLTKYVSESEEELAAYRKVGVWDEENNQVDLQKLCYYWGNYFVEADETFEYGSLGQQIITKPERITLYALSYQAGASLAQYLTEQYGMDAVISACMEQGKIEELCGKNFEELYNDWAVWNEEKYRQ